MSFSAYGFTWSHRAGGAGPTTPTLVGPKILSFMVKALYFQSYGRTNNCQIEVHFQMVGPILHSFRRPWKILIRARQIQREIAAQRNHFERNTSKTEGWYRIKGARMTAIMFCGIFLCYGPQIVTGALMQRLKNSQSSRIAFYWTIAVMLLNSFVNPIVYVEKMKTER